MKLLPAVFIASFSFTTAFSQESTPTSTAPAHPKLEARLELGFAQAHVLNGRSLRDANPNYTFSAGFSPVAGTTLRYTPRADGKLFFSGGLSAWFTNAGANLRIVGDNYQMDARFRQTTTVLAIPLRAGLHITRELDVEAGVAFGTYFLSRGASMSAGMSSWGSAGGSGFAHLEAMDMDNAGTARSYTSAMAEVQASHAFGRRWFVSLRGIAQLGEGPSVHSRVSLTTGAPTATPQIYSFAGRPRLAWIMVGAGTRIF